ncbi:MAG: pyridine nucleotide-disulfide oxidoreductase [Alphaproteobacteria bacterium]|nr:pyridine nucleotide-disulfide oxidoreductase [Alphaproteobacteria bacterium]
MPISVVIVGSGPSGFYVAEALIKSEADVAIDIVDRLPTPYGLIRGGVAPDHQSTKRVTRAYERTALNEKVRYYGNVELGRDVSLDELRAAYDAVVLTIGMPGDSKLGVPGEDKKGVIGSAAFVGWYNGHPDFKDLDPCLETGNVVVIGNGNVAIDVARVLVKTPAEMTEADLPRHVSDAIQASPVTDVYMVGRRGPVEAKFTNVELREMGQLENAAAIVDPGDLPEEVTGDWSDRDKRLRERNLASLKEFSTAPRDGKAKSVHFTFYAKPVEIVGPDRVTGARLEKTRVVNGRAEGTGAFVDIECGLVVPAIGYTLDPPQDVPFDQSTGTIRNDNGRVEDGVYVAGWAKRGPSGVIGTNKPDGQNAAAQILEDVKNGSKPGRTQFETLLKSRNIEWVDFAAWQRIDAAEVANAPPGAPREKFVTTADMLKLLGSAS